MDQARYNNELISKYWAGDCSQEEEQLIRDNISEQADGASDESIRHYMQYMTLARKQQLDSAFDKDVWQQISQPKRAFRLRRYLRIAASIILLAAVFFIFHRFSSEQLVADNKTEFVDTFESSEEAYEAVKEAMMLISSNMNTAKKHTEMISVFHSANERVMGNTKDN